ncbi:MAG: cytochrome b5 domain-containing protein [Candidatus Saccharibacteria bacterium]
MKKVLITLAVILGLTALGYGVYALTRSQTAATSPAPLSSSVSTNSSAASNSPQPSSASKTITTSELAKNNGKNGVPCWVAVNGTVYNVTGSKEWVNGEHVPSNGQAKCGRDESSSIGQSPHGTSVLAKLPVIGTLQ